MMIEDIFEFGVCVFISFVYVYGNIHQKNHQILTWMILNKTR